MESNFILFEFRWKNVIETLRNEILFYQCIFWQFSGWITHFFLMQNVINGREFCFVRRWVMFLFFLILSFLFLLLFFGLKLHRMRRRKALKSADIFLMTRVTKTKRNKGSKRSKGEEEEENEMCYCFCIVKKYVKMGKIL